MTMKRRGNPLSRIKKTKETRMSSFSPRMRLLLLFLALSVPLVVQCGSGSDGGGVWFPPLTCDKELLTGGTYLFTVTLLGDCFEGYSQTIRDIFNNTPLVVPNWQDIPTNPHVTLTIDTGTDTVIVNAIIVEQDSQFVLTSIDPNPVQVDYQGNHVSAFILSVVICPTAEDIVTVDIEARVSVEGITVCEDKARITGGLQ